MAPIVAATICVACVSAAPLADGIVTTRDGILEARDTGDAIVLTPWQRGVAFSAAISRDASLAALKAVLNRAMDESRAVTFRFDATHGRVDRATGAIVFPLCNVALDELAAGPDAACAPVASSGDTPDAILAAGTASLLAGDLQRAKSYFDRLPPSPGDARDPLLLRQRATFAGEMAANAADPTGRVADGYRVAALRDWRALAAFTPKDMDAQAEVGIALEDLGAYSDAREHYEQLLATHPEEQYRLRTRIGAIYRREGKNALALDQLNRLAAAKGGKPSGMKYFYHRGWTLTNLGRFDEAVAALSEGIAQQPDYAWAYMRRACASAQAGRSDAAQLDVSRAVEQMSEVVTGSATPAAQSLLSDVRLLADAMTAAARDGKQFDPARVCTVGPRSDEEARARSPLLPPS